MNIHIYLSLQKFTCDFFLRARAPTQGPSKKILSKRAEIPIVRAGFEAYFTIRRGYPTILEKRRLRGHFLRQQSYFCSNN